MEHDFQPDHRVYGYEPSSWLSFIVPAFRAPDGKPSGRQALNFPLGRNAVPMPLRVYPPMPGIVDQGAEVPAEVTGLAEALLWTYRFTVSTPQAAQDELMLVVRLNDPPPGKNARPRTARIVHNAVTGDDPPRPPPADLFEALARFTFEYPQIAPHLATVPDAAFSGGNATVARKALERTNALIEGVAQTWAEWIHPASRGAADARRRGRADDAPISVAAWHYTVDFSQLPNLKVTRSVENSTALPPWPDIAGFTTPTSDKPTDLYIHQPMGDASTLGQLAFRVPGLFSVVAQSARVTASVTRNANIVPSDMPPGTAVNGAFIYTTPVVEAKDPVVPLLALPGRPIVIGRGANTLSAALDALLAPFTDGPALPGLSASVLKLATGGSYFYVLAEGGPDQTLPAGIRIFLSRNDIAFSAGTEGSNPDPGTYKKMLLSTLSRWHNALQPSDAGASIRFSLTLFAEITDSSLPLLELDDVQIEVPENNQAWWADA